MDSSSPVSTTRSLSWVAFLICITLPHFIGDWFCDASLNLVLKHARPGIAEVRWCKKPKEAISQTQRAERLSIPGGPAKCREASSPVHLWSS